MERLADEHAFRGKLRKFSEEEFKLTRCVRSRDRIEHPGIVHAMHQPIFFQNGEEPFHEAMMFGLDAPAGLKISKRETIALSYLDAQLTQCVQNECGAKVIQPRQESVVCRNGLMSLLILINGFDGLCRSIDQVLRCRWFKRSLPNRLDLPLGRV